MLYLAKTETGSTYTIDMDLEWWSKNDDIGHPLHIFKTPPADPQPRNFAQVAEITKDLPPASAPEVGKRIYLHAPEQWHYSTVVVEVIEQ